MEKEQGPNIISLEGSSPSINPFFDPLVRLDFEIESNSIGNHMMVEEKKDTAMDIVSWKPHEEFTFSVYNASNLLLWHLGLQNPVFQGFSMFLGDASTHGSHIGPVTLNDFTRGVYDGEFKKGTKGADLLASLCNSYKTSEDELRKTMEKANGLIADILKKKPCPASQCVTENLENIDTG
ncbi:hypothetical protein RHMOL_Rhmol06G0141000 [Rhododendron molle]|uniref:Uncharacterized protein n=1 Tax=Rhododendron molle TaxID=49168 RepID=A0ACC0NCA1_RHOML|nr:hypothetical protein RHMOL_Rhmol06G0141000 [Rhododendron molle]